jgi:4-amino-4-deoxy-L-arabinose transferase-like glycosyltransferase
MADPLVGATQDVLKTPLELFYANHILRPYGWFPKFPPGWPLVLSLGYLIHARWLPNAIFGTLQLVAIAAIGSRWFSRETGVLAALFAALSQFYLINSIGMMSHALCALLAATACLALSAAMSTGKLRYYAAMFACLAGTFQVRPYTGFVLTFVMTCAALWFARNDRGLLIRVLGVGALFGAFAVAGVLIYNHTYTGHWLVSPYAEAAGGDAPPELSLGPATLLRGMMRHGPFMLLETLLGAFPFLHLLAGYAVVQEKNHRREVWFLAALYLGLVLSYLAHPEGYAVFFGERFHFEAFFALALLAARGTQLLIEHWRIRRKAVSFALLVLGGLQIGQLAFAVQVVSMRGEPYRKVRAAVTNSNFSGLVFLRDSPGFVAKHFNLNDADWRHAARVYLVDAEADHRADWACRYGFSRWWVVGYDHHAHAAVVEPGETDCSAAKVP